MAYLELSNPTTKSCDYKVGLSSPFNTTYYKEVRITGSNYGSSTSKVSSYVGRVIAKSSSSKYVKGTVNEGMSAGRTYTLYAYAQAQNGTWYRAGSDSITMKKDESANAKITFSSSVDKNVVTSHAQTVIKEILADAGLSSAKITSTIRTPEKQATIMYDNCKSLGVQSQKDLYGSAGDKVIDTYVNSVKAGKSKDTVIKDMIGTINSLWPTRVSLHCVPVDEYKKLNVIDIGMSSISNKSSFVKALDRAKSSGKIKKYIVEDKNSCYHLEIPGK